ARNGSKVIAATVKTKKRNVRSMKFSSKRFTSNWKVSEHNASSAVPQGVATSAPKANRAEECFSRTRGGDTALGSHYRTRPNERFGKKLAVGPKIGMGWAW